MKKLVLYIGFFLLGSLSLFAQEEDENEGNDKIRDKMNEYIQKRLALTDAEAKKFSPIFLEYFKEWRQTLQTYRGPDKKLERQQKVVELRLKYRTQFQGVIGEGKGARVFDFHDRFIMEMRQLQRNRPQNNRPLRRG